MAEEKEGKGGKGKLIIIILAVVVLLAAGGGGAAWFLLKPKAEPTPAQLAAAREKSMHFISLDPFVTNLQSQDGQTHYLQVKVDLKTYDPHADEEVTQMMPMIRNNILRILAGQEAEKVSSVESQDHLRTEILNTVNGLLQSRGGAPAAAHAGEAHAAPAGHGAAEQPIAGVYFTAFVVQ